MNISNCYGGWGWEVPCILCPGEGVGMGAQDWRPKKVQLILKIHFQVTWRVFGSHHIRVKRSKYFGKIYIIEFLFPIRTIWCNTLKIHFWVIWGFLGHLGVRGSRYLGQIWLKTLPVPIRINWRIKLFCTPTHCRLSSNPRTDRRTDWRTLQNIEEICRCVVQ